MTPEGPEMFGGISKFLEDLSEFERDKIKGDLSDLVEGVHELLVHYRILKRLHDFREKGELDGLHKELFTHLMARSRRHFESMEEYLSWYGRHSLGDLFESLGKMRFLEYIQEDLEDFEKFTRTKELDLWPLREIGGFSPSETEEIALTVNRDIELRMNKLIEAIKKRILFEEGLRKFEESLSLYFERLRVEGFLLGKIGSTNQESKKLFKIILIMGTAGFLLGHDITVGNPITIATALIAIASLL